MLKSIVESFKSSKLDLKVKEAKRKRTKTLDVLRGTAKLHQRARGPYPSYPSRFEVADEMCDCPS